MINKIKCKPRAEISKKPLEKFPIILFGGSFNPIHNGHIMMIKEILRINLTYKILISCTYQNPFKNVFKNSDEKNQNANHRLQMVKCATAGLPCVEIYDTELRTKKVSYTIDTVKNIYSNMDFKTEKGQKIGLIIGSDLLKDIWRWKDVHKLSTLVKLIVYPRAQYDGILHNKEKNTVAKILSHGKYQFEYKILSGVEMCDISSKQLRGMYNSKKLIDYVPKKVYEYIRTYGVYE